MRSLLIIFELTMYNNLCSLSVSAPESSCDDASGSKKVDLHEEQVRNSGSDSPLSDAASDHQLPDKESSSPQNFDNYGDIGLVRDNSPSYAPSEPQQQDPPELSGFSVSLLSHIFESFNFISDY